jgi:hypothetical protein
VRGRVRCHGGMLSVPTWLVLALLGWLGAVVWICAILTAAKRGAGPDDPPSPLPLATLDRLVWDVRAELAVDQVLIVVCDEHAPGGAVVVAGAGVPASLLGAVLTPEDSVAAAVAESGRDALAAGHGALDRPRGRDGAVGDAAAIALAVPLGAVAVARLDAARPLMPADLVRLRTLVRRQSSRFARAAPRLPAARADAAGANANGAPRPV